MKIKSPVKAGDKVTFKGLRVKSNLKTGGPMLQHNQTITRAKG